MVARLFNVSRAAVLHWVRAMGKTLPIAEIDTEVKENKTEQLQCKALP
jgi:hypothetical protein